ncbi:MAG: hypothetical protein QME76_07280 [Bacillota bacterium]|nr:hypothetical protein [Bacillota bacterium]
MRELGVHAVCAACYERGHLTRPEARLRFREETVERNGNLLRLVGIPYYACPRCGAETYELRVEAFVEQAVRDFLDGETAGGTIDVAKRLALNEAVPD